MIGFAEPSVREDRFAGFSAVRETARMIRTGEEYRESIREPSDAVRA